MTTQSIHDEIEAILAAKEKAAADVLVAFNADAARCAALDTAKARCLAECAEVTAALAEATDPDVRVALVQMEERIHASHADELARAYLVFSGQREEDSNPATPGAPTQIDAAVVVTTEDPQ